VVSIRPRNRSVNSGAPTRKPYRCLPIKTDKKLKFWKRAEGVLGIAIATIFIFSNTSGFGFARVGVAKLVLLCTIYAAAIWAFFMIKHDLAPNARAAVIADFAIAGLCVMLLGELKRSSDATLNMFKGAGAESKTATSATR